MSAIRAMLFDLDGTLLDSAPDLIDALNRVRASRGLSPLAVADMSPFASKGAIGLLNAGMPAADDAEQFESWRLLFLEHYAKNSFRHSTLYDGVPELLEFLGREGIPWGVVTNKPEYLTFPIIEAADLQASVSCVVCGDTLSQRKPHPAPVSLACGILGVAPENALMVGDDPRDIEAGRAAGTRTAAAHYGYGSAELTASVAGESLQIHHPADLIGVIRQR